MAMLRLPMKKIPAGARCRSTRCKCLYMRLAEAPPEERTTDGSPDGWWEIFEWVRTIQPCSECARQYEASQRTGDKRWPGKTIGTVCPAFDDDLFEVELIETIGSL